MPKKLIDGMLKLDLPDFIIGLVSDTDYGDLQPNEAGSLGSPDCENVYFAPGRMIGRRGYIVRNSALPGAGDGAYYFNDSNGARRLAVFSNGNLYEMMSHSLTLVASGVYTAGNRVCAAAQSGILYFSDGETIHSSGGNQSGIRYYDPVTSAVAAPLLVSSGTAATIATPACKAICFYNGQILIGNIKYVGGTYAKDSVLWGNFLDPTTIVGTNIFRVSAGVGGEINCLVPMGIATSGISPRQAVFVGKNIQGVSILEGALSVSDLSEKIINAPVGVLDGYTTKFIPGTEGSGMVLWLGTDRQIHWTNGVNSDVLSNPISKEFSQAITDRLSANTDARFHAVRDWNNNQYILDTGIEQSSSKAVAYVFDWQHKYWSRYKGQCTGFWAEAKNDNSENVMYCATADSLAQFGVGLYDNETAITKYWNSGWLSMGDAELYKQYLWVFAAFRTDTGSVTIRATTDQGTGNYAETVLTPSSAPVGDEGDLVWDAGNWDEKNWAAGGGISQPPYKLKKRLGKTNADGTKGLLGGYDVQVKISDSSTAYFEILKCALLYKLRGRRRAA